jgi:hypothetical protein
MRTGIRSDLIRSDHGLRESEPSVLVHSPSSSKLSSSKASSASGSTSSS